MGKAKTVSRWLAIAVLAVVLTPSAAWAVATQSLRSVSFSDTTHGYIAGGFNTHGVVSWTNDGGVSWHASAPWTSHFAVGVRASSDGGTVTAMTDVYEDVLWESSNHGLNWVATPSLDGRSAKFEDIAYLADNRRVAVGKRGTVDQSGFIATALGSDAWNLAFDWPDKFDNDQVRLTNHADMTAVDAAPGGNVAWAVGSDYTRSVNPNSLEVLIYKTSNGGLNWTNQTPAATSPKVITCVSAANTTTAFIGRQNNVLLRTINGGTAWDAITIPSASIGWVNAIDTLDADHVLVVGASSTGSGGRIAFTANASSATRTWSANTAPAGTPALFGAKMIDANNWIVVGDNETILRTSNAGVTWTGPTAITPPTVAITSPSSSADTAVEGTSTDGLGIGVAKVEVRIQRADDSKYWDGTSWITASTWRTAAPSDPANGWDEWSATSLLPVGASGLTVSARATDGLGNVGPVVSIGADQGTAIAPSRPQYIVGYGLTATITGTLKTATGEPVIGKPVTLRSGTTTLTVNTGSDGSFTFTRKPTSRAVYKLGFAAAPGFKAAPSVDVVVLPRARIDRPVVATTRTHTKAFNTYVNLFPRHTAGTSPIKFTFQRWEKVKGKYVWVSHGTFSAKAVNYKTWTRCTVSRKLLAGSWHVQAAHVGTEHSTSLSALKSFTVK